MVSCKVTIRKFKMLYLGNERHHATRCSKNIFLGHIDKNSETLQLWFWNLMTSPICLTWLEKRAYIRWSLHKTFFIGFLICQKARRFFFSIYCIGLEYSLSIRFDVRDNSNLDPRTNLPRCVSYSRAHSYPEKDVQARGVRLLSPVHFVCRF